MSHIRKPRVGAVDPLRGEVVWQLLSIQVASFVAGGRGQDRRWIGGIWGGCRRQIRATN